MSQPPRKRVCVGESGSEATGKHTGDLQQPRTPSPPDTRPGTVLGENVGDVAMGSLDDELELPDSDQLASSQEMAELGTRRVLPQSSSSEASSDPATFGLLRTSRPLQPALSNAEVGHMLIIWFCFPPTSSNLTAAADQLISARS